MPQLDFWYDFASPYSYPAAMRVAEIAEAAGVDIAWRPFVLGPIFAKKGLETSPMKADPVKGAYAWRDLARICAGLGLPFREPPGFPQNGVLASRVALVLDDAARTAFTRAVYAAEFGDGAVVSEPAVLASILDGLGHPSSDIMEAATNAANRPLLRQQTGAAEAAGIFGAPSFVAEDGELFWGHDRMEQAVAWAAGETLRAKADGRASQSPLPES